MRKNYLRETTVAGVTYYHTMKYADLECGANGYGGNNWIVMRYADVALMLAEAYYWQGTEPTAKSFLNMVRKRAGLGDWSGTDLRQGIYDERRNEFIQEGLRWQDLLRMYSKQEMIEHFNAINPNFGRKINRRRHAIHKQNHIDPLGDRNRAVRCLLRQRHGGPRTGKRDADHRLDARSSGQGRRSRLLARRQSG